MSTQVPTLAGTAEVAQALGCKKQQVYALRRREDFPEPVMVLAATPIWMMEDVESFAATWKRRS
jgi:predicted DNA-binding transcriptional regulator AlpA